jgi:hypothetical protein
MNMAVTLTIPRFSVNLPAVGRKSAQATVERFSRIHPVIIRALALSAVQRYTGLIPAVSLPHFPATVKEARTAIDGGSFNGAFMDNLDGGGFGQAPQQTVDSGGFA